MKNIEMYDSYGLYLGPSMVTLFQILLIITYSLLLCFKFRYFSEDKMEKELAQNPAMCKLVRRAFPILTEGETVLETMFFNYRVPASFILLQFIVIVYLISTAMIVFFQVFLTTKKTPTIFKVTLRDYYQSKHDATTSDNVALSTSFHLSDAVKSVAVIFIRHYTITGISLAYVVAVLKTKRKGKRWKILVYFIHVCMVSMIMATYSYLVYITYLNHLFIFILHYVSGTGYYTFEFIFKDLNYLLILFVEMISFIATKWWRFQELVPLNGGSVNSDAITTVSVGGNALGNSEIKAAINNEFQHQPQFVSRASKVQ